MNTRTESPQGGSSRTIFTGCLRANWTLQTASGYFYIKYFDILETESFNLVRYWLGSRDENLKASKITHFFFLTRKTFRLCTNQCEHILYVKLWSIQSAYLYMRTHVPSKLSHFQLYDRQLLKLRRQPRVCREG